MAAPTETYISMSDLKKKVEAEESQLVSDFPLDSRNHATQATKSSVYIE